MAEIPQQLLKYFTARGVVPNPPRPPMPIPPRSPVPAGRGGGGRGGKYGGEEAFEAPPAYAP